MALGGSPGLQEEADEVRHSTYRGWQMVKQLQWNDMERLQGRMQEITSYSGAVSCDPGWPVMSALCCQENLL